MNATLPIKMTAIAADAARLLADCVGDCGAIRIGVDVVSVSRFESSLATRGGDAFVRSRFTEAEREYCEGRPERLAVRWAAKEAVAKAIGTGFRGLRPGDIEIVHQPWGEPAIRSSAAVAWPKGAQHWRWTLSLSHEGDAALAFVCALVTTEEPIEEGGSL
jgi:holo-[acyl-carrier protein] synthase